jgi:hypothetical protein
MLLRINAPKVISETIDSEAVVINLDSGTYYSLEGTAGEIWALVEHGLDPGRIVGVLRSRHHASGNEIEAAVGDFLAELEGEELLVPADGGSFQGDAPDEPAGQGNLPFSPPRVARYTDLQHLIALDPIHEVEPSAGWPHQG